jgi:hypothetical protein
MLADAVCIAVQTVSDVMHSRLLLTDKRERLCARMQAVDVAISCYAAATAQQAGALLTLGDLPLRIRTNPDGTLYYDVDAVPRLLVRRLQPFRLATLT